MTSTRPTQRQRVFDFGNEADTTHAVAEPQGGQSCAAAMEKSALDSLSEDLLEQIVDPDNLERAWRNVKGNREAPGPDGITLEQFPEHFRVIWPELRSQLLDGTYRPEAARRKAIPKPDGGERLLGIPNITERLLQQAILQVLQPIFDPDFSESSFGFRPKRSAHGAVKQVRSYIQQGYRFAVDMDLSKFFDRVQHDVLMSRVARKVGDKRLLRLIGCYLRAGIMVDGFVQPSPEGTMQGGPLSPLLANILLDDLAKFKEKVRSITGRSRGISMRRLIGELRQYLRGWMGYFALATTKNIFTELDGWIRRRVRMCFWKQWRLPRTRIRKLKQLGVPHDLAVRHGTSRKAYWRLAKMLGGQMGMTKRWLLDQGLVFLRYLWSELAPLRRTA